MKTYYPKHCLLKDKWRRYLFSKNEICFLSFKLLIESNFSKKKLKRCMSLMNGQFLSHSLATISNRCLATGKNRPIFRKFRLSRIHFRQVSDFGRLSGIRRSCW